MAKKQKVEEQQVPAKAVVEVATKSEGQPWVNEKTEEEDFGIHVFKTQPAVVSIKYGLTLNMDNFESARIDVGLSMPCYAEQMDQAYAGAESWVKSRVEKEVAEIRSHIEAKKKAGKLPF